MTTYERDRAYCLIELCHKMDIVLYTEQGRLYYTADKVPSEELLEELKRWEGAILSVMAYRPLRIKTLCIMAN